MFHKNYIVCISDPNLTIILAVFRSQYCHQSYQPSDSLDFCSGSAVMGMHGVILKCGILKGMGSEARVTPSFQKTIEFLRLEVIYRVAENKISHKIIAISPQSVV